MTPQLLHYQTTITRFNQSYPIPAWRAYDPTLRWDVIDEVIATDVLRTFMQQGSTATLPSPVTCYRCRLKGHLAAQCLSTLRNSYGRGGGGGGGGAPEAARLGSLIHPTFAMTTRPTHRWIVTLVTIGAGPVPATSEITWCPFASPSDGGKGPAHVTRITPLADASGTAVDLTGVPPAMVHTQGFHAATTDTHTHGDHNHG